MFAEDLTPFFNAAEMATQATLNGAAVVGIIEEGYRDPTLAGYGDGPGSSPSFTLASTSVPAGVEGKTLTIASGPSAGSYRIANARHDGTGVCTLDLIT